MVYYFVRQKGFTEDSWTHTSIALYNGGSIRASIEQGEITVEDVLAVLPYGNLVEKIEVHGSTLLEMLERSIEGYRPERPRGQFLQVSGRVTLLR